MSHRQFIFLRLPFFDQQTERKKIYIESTSWPVIFDHRKLSDSMSMTESESQKTNIARIFLSRTNLHLIFMIFLATFMIRIIRYNGREMDSTIPYNISLNLIGVICIVDSGNHIFARRINLGEHKWISILDVITCNLLQYLCTDNNLYRVNYLVRWEKWSRNLNVSQEMFHTIFTSQTKRDKKKNNSEIKWLWILAHWVMPMY